MSGPNFKCEDEHGRITMDIDDNDGPDYYTAMVVRDGYWDEHLLAPAEWGEPADVIYAYSWQSRFATSVLILRTVASQ